MLHSGEVRPLHAQKPGAMGSRMQRIQEESCHKESPKMSTSKLGRRGHIVIFWDSCSCYSWWSTVVMGEAVVESGLCSGELGCSLYKPPPSVCLRCPSPVLRIVGCHIARKVFPKFWVSDCCIFYLGTSRCEEKPEFLSALLWNLSFHISISLWFVFHIYKHTVC